ncbi:hypothetical protein TNCV_4791831 [Trichonephila clavipes]|nr:hypothetical protein TNCV_4791831 [Trichonephila clavipes]
MYTTTEITVCPFSNKHSAALMSPNIVTNGFRAKRSSAWWLLELDPHARVAKRHSHALSSVKSSSTRLRHILLHTFVPFHEITPTNIQQPRGKMLHIKNMSTRIKMSSMINPTWWGAATKRIVQKPFSQKPHIHADSYSDRLNGVGMKRDQKTAVIPKVVYIDSQNSLYRPPGVYDDLQGVHDNKKTIWRSMRRKWESTTVVFIKLDRDFNFKR